MYKIIWYIKYVFLIQFLCDTNVKYLYCQLIIILIFLDCQYIYNAFTDKNKKCIHW